MQPGRALATLCALLLVSAASAWSVRPSRIHSLKLDERSEIALFHVGSLECSTTKFACRYDGRYSLPATVTSAAGFTQASCGVPQELHRHTGSVQLELVCDDAPVSEPVNLWFFTDLKVEALTRSIDCDETYCLTFIDVATDLPLAALVGSAPEWRASCGQHRPWAHMSAASLLDAPGGLHRLRLEFGVINSSPSTFHDCTLTLDRALMTPLPLTIPAAGNLEQLDTVNVNQLATQALSANRRLLKIGGGMYGTNYDAATGVYGVYGGPLGFAEDNKDVYLTGAAEFQGSLKECIIGVDNNYYNIAENEGVDMSLLDETQVLTGNAGGWNITNVGPSVTYNSVLRLKPSMTIEGVTVQCVDTLTSKPLDMWLSAPLDYSTINLVSTLVVEVMSVYRVSQAQAEQLVKQMFGLPSDINLGETSPFQDYAVSKKSEYEALGKANAQLHNVLSLADFITGNEKGTAANKAEVKAWLMYGVARSLMPQWEWNTRRKLLAAPFDLSDLTSLKAIVSNVVSAMNSAGSSAAGTGVADPALVDAAVTAVTNMQAALAQLTDPLQILQAMYVATDGLASLLADLASGVITPEAFAASTAAAELLNESQTNPVPGSLIPNPCAPGLVPVWSSTCMSPDPFSCTTAGGAGIVPGVQCVNPPNWDVSQARLDFSYEWDLATIGAQSTGAYYSLYQLNVASVALPAGDWEIQILPNPGHAPVTIILGHMTAPPDVLSITTAVVPIANPITHLTVIFNPEANTEPGSAAISMRYLGAPLPDPVTPECASTQAPVYYTTCGNPSVCPTGAFHKCFNAPHYNPDNKTLAYSTLFPNRWTLPNPLFWSDFYYVSVIDFPVTGIAPGVYYLEFHTHRQVSLTVALTTSSGQVLSYTSTTTSLMIPEGGVTSLTITFRVGKQAATESAGFWMYWVAPCPVAPGPAPPGQVVVFNSFAISVTISNVVEGDVKMLAAFIEALKQALAKYFSVPVDQILINDVFIIKADKPKVMQVGRRQLRQVTEMQPPAPAAPPPSDPIVQMHVTVASLLDQSDADLAAALQQLLDTFFNNPSGVIPADVADTYNLGSDQLTVTALPSPPSPPANPSPPTSPNPPMKPPPVPTPPSSPPSPLKPASPPPPSTPRSPPPPTSPGLPPPSPMNPDAPEAPDTPSSPVLASPSPVPSPIPSPRSTPPPLSAASPVMQPASPPPPGSGNLNAGPLPAGTPDEGGSNKAGVIAPAVVVPVVVVGAALAVAGYFFMKKKSAAAAGAAYATA